MYLALRRDYFSKCVSLKIEDVKYLNLYPTSKYSYELIKDHALIILAKAL